MSTTTIELGDLSGWEAPRVASDAHGAAAVAAVELTDESEDPTAVRE